MFPGYSPPLRNTEDIPIQRDSIGAMTMNTVAPPFKAYVYRGTGEDQIEMAAWLRAEAEREQREHWENERKEAAQRERAKRQRQREKEQEERAVQSIPDLIAKMHAGIERALKRAAARENEIPPLPPKRRRRWDGVVRAAPGWKPLTGADLEDMWSVLDET